MLACHPRHLCQHLPFPKLVFSDLKDKVIVGTFYGKELQKTNQKELRIENVIKRKGDKLYVKKKGYDNSFNSWINKKDIVI